MTITQMTAAHIPQIAALEQQCFSAPWDAGSLGTVLSNELALWRVALEGDTVAGYIGAQTGLGEADMMNLAVRPDCRGRGIGEALTRALLSALKERGCHSLSLEVRPSNLPAGKLYEKLGFLEVGRRPNYYLRPREDARILRKEWDV